MSKQNHPVCSLITTTKVESKILEKDYSINFFVKYPQGLLAVCSVCALKFIHSSGSVNRKRTKWLGPSSRWMVRGGLARSRGQLESSQRFWRPSLVRLTEQMRFHFIKYVNPHWIRVTRVLRRPLCEEQKWLSSRIALDSSIFFLLVN